MTTRPLSALLLALLASAALAQTEEPVTIPGPEYDTPGILTRPASAEVAPAVLLIHGFASDKEEVGGFYRNLADRLAEAGYVSLRFDFPGSGDHTEGFEVNTITTFVRDAQNAFEWLAAHDWVDAERMGIVGFSLGGAVASLIAGQDERVDALVLWSTPGNLATSQRELYEQYYDAAREQGTVEADLGFRTVTLSPEFFESRFAYFPLHAITTYTAPLLVVHGEADDTVPVEAARELVANAGSYDITLRIVPGADHIFNVLTSDPSDSELVLDITTAWLGEKLTEEE